MTISKTKITPLLLAALIWATLLPAVAFAEQEDGGVAVNDGTAPLNASAITDASIGFSSDDPIFLGDSKSNDAIALSAQSNDSASTASGASPSKSGLTDVAKPTLAELRTVYNSLPAHPSSVSSMWSAPSDPSAYKAGTLSPSSIASAQAYLNLIRRSANLDPVTFENTLNANAAQGALILAALDNGLTHYPETPENASDAQAEAGKYACSTSNLSYLWGDWPNLLWEVIQGQMDDEGLGNMACVGHRRWLLKPTISTMGIGSAYSDSGAVFASIRVFDHMNANPEYGTVQHDGSSAYNYVAWPASGAFLNDLFAVGIPWSVSLNDNVYGAPDSSDVKVTVQRLSDGKSWHLDEADSEVTETGEYFTVENSGYGDGWCIIFNPGSANIGASRYKGSYKVQITGLKTVEGATTSIEYQVDFASAKVDLASEGGKIAPIASMSYDGSAKKPTPSVTLGNKKLKKGVDYTVSYKRNTNVGDATAIVKGKGIYTGSIKATFKILQAKNKVFVKKAKIIKRLKAKSLKIQAKTLTLPKVSTKFGKAKWKVVTKDKKKALVLKGSKVKVKKGTKKGNYVIKLKASVAKTKNYKAANSKVVSVEVKVK